MTLDTPERLNTQLHDYYKAFSEVYVFTHESLLNKYKELLPAYVGLLVYQSSCNTIEERKATSITQHLDIKAMMGSLRKPEYLKLVKTLAGFIPEATPVFLYRVDIFSEADREIKSHFLDYLRNNFLFPSDEPLTQDEAEKFREASRVLDEKSLDIIVRMALTPKKRSEVLNLVEVSNQTFNFKSFLLPLMERDLIRQTIKERVSSPNQRYQLTKQGVRYQKFLLMVLESINKTE